MKKKIFLMLSLALLVGLVICGTMQANKNVMPKNHDGLTEQQKLMGCADCHKNTTPEIYSEWYKSTHGIVNVKCYQCHNTFENLKTTPDFQQSCNSCHADQVSDKDHLEGQENCWECHAPHSFIAE